tara:strand:+ start:329 stop:2338 length:2010 start_codon:yes stop_codon:yes gene_type:complete
MDSNFNSISDMETKALDFAKIGRYKESEDLYRYLIKIGSKNSIVFTNLAALMQIKGDRSHNVFLLKKAISLDPNLPQAHSNLGLELVNIGELDNAINSYKEALKLDPNYAEAHNNFGQVMEIKSNLDKAINSYQKAIDLRPDYSEAHFNLGNALKEKKEIYQAIDKYQTALKFNPNFVQAYNNLGILLHEKSEYSKAIKNYKLALNIEPNYLDALCNLGNSYYELKELNKAIFAYKKAIQINPKFIEVLNNLGNVYKDIGNYDEAIGYYKRSLLLDKNFYQADCNLGKIYQMKDNLLLSRKSYLSALNKNNKHLESLNNLGILNQLEGKINDALSLFLKCRELEPDFPDANLNLAYLQLLMGDYENGLINYEWRKNVKKPIRVHCKVLSEEWNGEEKLSGNKLLVISEQGLGDNFQLMRYLIYLKKLGYEITYCVPKKLHSIMISSKINAKLITLDQGKSFSGIKWISIVDLLKLLKVSAQNPLIEEPYLFPSKELISKWKNYFDNEKKDIIGINWQGNPDVEKENLLGRSFPLNEFLKITKNDFKFLSLQKGFGSEQISTCKFVNKFVSFQNEINHIRDFNEIAAMIHNCRLIITSDSCVAHLAGAMGKETWLLLHFVPDWRWGLSEESTFWYPSLRIFRQSKRNDWKEVFERVKIELDNLKIDEKIK